MSEFQFLSGLKNKVVKMRFSENIEPHEIFLDALAQRQEAEFGISEKKIEVPLSRRTIRYFLLLSVLVLFFLVTKTFQFQILENQKFLALSEKNKFMIHSIQAIRGVIYDSKGEQLVFNNVSFDLVVDKRKLPELKSDEDQLLREVASMLKKDFSAMEKEINENNEPYVLVSGNLDHSTLILLETKIKELPGFEIRPNATRTYKDGFIFSHILGYTGKINPDEFEQKTDSYSIFDYVGRTGLEKSYEETLRKKPGQLQIEKDALGKELSQKTISSPEPGNSLVLWTDADLQRKVEEELKKVFNKTGTKAGAAVALDPKTGGVLALVSLPTYDNNLFTPGVDPVSLNNLLSDESQPLFNRAIAAKYPTGSTIKPLEAAAALEEKLISPTKEINCEGKITIPSQYDPSVVYEYHDWAVHGPSDMRKALAESCSVYFYVIGGGYKNQSGLGPTRIKKYLELFGWGNKTGVDLPHEEPGFIPSPDWKKATRKEGWWDGDTYNLSIGQGDIGITPLQVAASFVPIANGGTLYQPQIVRQIIDSDKQVMRNIEPEVIRSNFIEPEYLQVVREGMRQGVTGEGSPHATVTLLNSLPVKAAAKTGTAQTPNPEYYDKWITVFAPYDNPEIVLTIIVESAEYEELTATGVAKEVLNWYFNKN